jgi:hypothetical protein
MSIMPLPASNLTVSSITQDYISEFQATLSADLTHKLALKHIFSCFLCSFDRRAKAEQFCQFRDPSKNCHFGTFFWPVERLC